MGLIFLKNFFSIKIKKISDALYSKGLVFLLLSNFLLSKKSHFLGSEYNLNIVTYFSLIIIFFFYLFFFKFIGKINVKKFSQLFIIIIIIYLINIFFKNFLLLINLPGYSSLGQIFHKFFSFFFKNIYSLILGYVFQYLIIFIIITNNINKIYKIIKILNISGYVFFVLFFILILKKEIKEINNYNLNIITNRENNKIKEIYSKTLNTLIKKENGNKQVVWIIFDEFDPLIAFDIKYKKYLENFEKLKENSFYASKIYPPAKNTIESIPAQLIGIHTNGNIVDSEGSLFIVDSKDKKKIEFNYKNSLFYKLNKDAFSTAIYSSVINYCSYIGNYKCKSSDPWKAHVRGLEVFFVFFSHINPLSKITKLKHHLLLVNKEDKSEDLDHSLLIENHKDIDIDFKNYISIKKNDIKELIDLDKITDELNSGTNLIFIHIFTPHLPSTYSENIFNIKPSTNLEKYIANLKLSDLILKSIYEYIVQIKNKEVMLIASSDHWLRDKDRNVNNYYPALLIAKINKDDTKIEFNSETNLIYLGNLIHGYLKNEILNHNEIEKFFYSNIDGTPPYIQPKIDKSKNE
jgi:hypothetical protein